MMPILRTTFCGIEHKNPLVIASATPSKDSDYMKRAVDAGAGGIIAKTISSDPINMRYVSPRFTILHKKAWPHNFSNYSCEFLAQYTPDNWMKELEETAEYCRKHDVRLFGSISGDTMDSWQDLAKKSEATGIDALELNFGCPHPRDIGYSSGQELGANPELSAMVTKAVVDVIDIPVIVKLTPEAVNPVDTALAVKEAGAAGLTVINRFPALDIDINTGRPLLHSTFAGVGGPWMRPITLKWIVKIGQATGLPISATNGIWTWKDIVKCIMVGASTVQTCTALMYSKKGFALIKEFLSDIEKFMVEKGYETIEDMRGITLPQILTWDKVDRDTLNYSVVNQDKCIGCGWCENWCFRGPAITYEEVNGKKKAKIDKDKCDGCGLCPSLCPAGAIALVSLNPTYLGDFD